MGIDRVARGGGDEIGLDGGREHAAAERLGQHQHIARLRADIFEDAVGMDESRDAPGRTLARYPEWCGRPR